jgi:5-enolpyruvylshikimate-3-phosphate synthase
MLAALARGRSELRHFAGSQDCQSTLRCLRGLGVEVEPLATSVFITGDGLFGLKSPSSPAFWPASHFLRCLRVMRHSPGAPWAESWRPCA